MISSREQLIQQQLPELRQLQLNWYRPPESLRIGQQWQVHLVLRSPRSLLNNLPFDYEAFLLSNGIDATGYIRSARLVSEPLGKPFGRRTLLDDQQLRHSTEAWPWLAGLVFGEQTAFTAAQWELAQRTGTLHLLVVSGLHVGLVTLLGLLIWGCIKRLFLLAGGAGVYGIVWPGVVLVMVLTGLYVWIAGAGIALQRAWVMLLVLLLLQQSRYRLRWPLALLIAAMVVLMINPLIWLRPGFGLSFAAVLALIVFLQGRNSSRADALWLPQLLVFVALLPLLLWWGQPVSLLQCVANLLAIPFLSLILLPLALLAVLIPHPSVDNLLVFMGDGYWELLHWLNNIPLPFVSFLPGVWLALVVIWLILIQRVVSWYVVWPAGLLLLLWFVRVAPAEPVVVLTDVGQGQSIMFITPEKVLVYDAGPKFSEHFDTGDVIVRPLLQRYGAQRIDELIISHADLDHAGGLEALRNSFEIGRLWSGDRLQGGPEATICHTAETEWRQLSPKLLYRFLNLSDDARPHVRRSSNNNSCVVQLNWYGHRFLLTGDISTDVERELVVQYGDELKSDVLLVGHHGSKTSSSFMFLQAVKPREAWISAGFNNRFGHPAAVVTDRLEQLQIVWRNTAEQGALQMNTEGVVIPRRQLWQPPWRQP